MKLWGLQHRPFPRGLTRTVAWQLLFVTFSQVSWFSEVWDSVPSPSCEVALLSPRLNLPCCPFFGLHVFQVICRPHISLPIDCSMSYLCIYHLLCYCTGFFAWPVNTPCYSTQMCPQNSQIGSWFCPCCSSNLSFHSRQYPSPSCPTGRLIPCPNLFCSPFLGFVPFPLELDRSLRFCLLKRMKWNCHAQWTELENLDVPLMPVPLQGESITVILLLVSSSIRLVPRQPGNM